MRYVAFCFGPAEEITWHMMVSDSSFGPDFLMQLWIERYWTLVLT